MTIGLLAAFLTPPLSFWAAIADVRGAMSRRFVLALTILLCLGLSLPALAVPGQDSGNGQGGGPPTTITNPGSGDSQGGGSPTTVTTQAGGNGQSGGSPTTVTTQAGGNGQSGGPPTTVTTQAGGNGNGSSTTVTTQANSNDQNNGNGYLLCASIFLMGKRYKRKYKRIDKKVSAQRNGLQ